MNNKSIAVLPFLNLSSDPENEYFSDGITEEIINTINRVNGLKVTARTSSFAFKGKSMDVRHIGNQLGVSTVLEGSIRKSNNKVRITAHLIRTSDGFHMWSGKYNRELTDIFELQDEISHHIVENIRENFGHLEIQDHLVDAPTNNIEAYNLYLKARYHHLKWDGDGIRTAIELYSQCIKLAPEFSWPYFGIGYCYAMSGSWGNKPEFVDLGEDYIKKGFELNPNSDLGYFALATVYFWGRWDIRKAVLHYKRAIEINDANTEAEEGLVELYTAIGEFEKAQEHIKHMFFIDPLSANHFYTKANIEYLTGDYESALASCKKGLENNDSFTHLIEKTQLCYIMLKDWNSLNAFIDANPLAENPDGSKFLYKLINDESYTQSERESVDFDVSKNNVFLQPWSLLLNSNAGNTDEAVRILSKMIEQKQGQYVNFKQMPMLAPLHGLPEFEQLKESTFEELIEPVVTPALIEVESESKALLSVDELNRAKEALESIMQEQKAYIDPKFSLRDLAEKIDLHPNKVSWLLNDQFELNFNDFVNGYRLQEFQERVLMPDAKQFSLLGLAFESGFSSKSTFNDYFKKKTGRTPSKWVKEHS